MSWGVESFNDFGGVRRCKKSIISDFKDDFCFEYLVD